MSQFRVDSEAIVASSASIRSTIPRIQQDAQLIATEMSNLQGAWEGQASTAFQAVVAEWRAAQLRVEEAIQSINQALDLTGQQYAEVEQANLRMFAR